MIDRDYTRLVGPVVRAIAATSERGALGKRLKELEAEAARLAEAGKRLTPDNAVARALLSDLDDALRANAALIDSVADDVVASGVRNAGAMVRGGAVAGMTDAQLAALGVAWNVPDPEAVARLVQYTSSDAWTAALEKYQEGTGKVAQNALTRAFIEGKGPIAAARELRAAVTGLPVAYAEQMTRTLQLTSLRDSAVAHRVANSHIIEYQIRIAALDDRTCVSCVALHGTELPLDARIDDHHRGRCTSVTKVRGMAAPAVESGPDWFARQSEDRQRAMMGGARFEAWKAGAIQWGDMSRVYDDPVFGRMVGEASLKGMLGADGAKQFYGGGPKGGGAAERVGETSFAYPMKSGALTVDEIRSGISEAGMDFDAFNYAISEYTQDGYWEIRYAQQNPDKGKAWAVESARRIEDGLAVLPRYDGPVYRGIKVAPEQYIGTLTPGDTFQLDAMASFTSKPTLSFLHEKDSVVFLVEQNRSGVSIRNLSGLVSEEEVLMPSQTAYRIKSVMRRSELPRDDFWFSPNPDDTSVLVKLEEVF